MKIKQTRTWRKKTKYAQLLLSFLLMTGPLADAACNLSLVVTNINAAWDMTWTAQAVSIQVSKLNPAACTFGLGFSQGGAGSYTRYGNNAGSHLNYQLYQDSGKTKILKDVPDVTSANDVIMITLPAGSNPQTELYYFDIPYSSATTPVLATSGTYLDTFIINAYEGSDPTLFAAPADATASVSVTMTVPKIIALSMVDTGSAFQDSATTKTINFGNLFTGQVSRFDLRLRSNAGFKVSVNSTNGGKMKHTTSTALVPYSLYVNNVLADPTGVIPVLTASTTTPLNGLGYPVKIVVGAIAASALSGSYADTVVITVETID